ncbi:MAG TPA: hypothetical protein VLZ74_07230 [Methylocella sp.]|nr:hypothetical protein [Methylocella sp.]
MAFGVWAAVLLIIATTPARGGESRPSDTPQASANPQAPAGTAASDTTDGAAPAGVTFEPAARAVSNWRSEARDNLELSQEANTKLSASADLPDTPRCIKLNNYWCIKRARWAGEIAADAEGHVAFASAIDGAIAAAMLLRRYYLDYNRHSALAILSHWAPPQCLGGTAVVGRPLKLHAMPLPPFAIDAPRGIQNTLRARWLAAHRQGFLHADGKSVLPHSIVPARPLALMPAPEIAVGMGERPRAPAQVKIAALEFTAPVEPPRTACLDENKRIENYALRAIEGIAASPNEDLNLFLPDGRAGNSLPRLLNNMARVEIGPMAARAGLIAAAIDRLAPRSLAAGVPRLDDSQKGASR